MLEMLKKIFNRGHGRFLEMLSDYVDGLLPEAERIALEAHLQGCDSCTEELESLRATVQMLRRMPEVEAPRSFRLAPAAVTAPTPPPERPVLLWTMRVSTALAVVAFTVMVASNVTGLLEGGGGDGGPAASERASDAARSATPTPEAMMESEPPARPSRPTPEAMMESEPDLAPRSTPMMIPEPTAMMDAMEESTATPVPAAMMESTAMPEPTAIPDGDDLEDTGHTVSENSALLLAPEPSPTATLVPTPAPKPTATPRPAPTTAPEPTATFSWTTSDPDPDDETGEGGGGVALGLTIGLGALGGALALGTIYLTLRRRRGAG